MNMGTLYRITSPSGKSYIGITSKTTEQRWEKHKEHAFGKRDAGALYSALRKYGHENFIVETLVICDKWDYLCELEKKAINSYRTKSPHGYNITDGGEGIVGLVITDKHRAAVSKAQKQRYKDPEQKQKLSEYGKKARANMLAKHEANRIDGMAPWEYKLWQQRVRVGSDEHKALISAAVKKTMATPECKEKLSKAAQARANNPEWKAKISASKTGKKIGPRSEEAKRKQSEGMKSAWAKRKALKLGESNET